MSLANLKESHAVDKVEFEKSLNASDEKLANAECYLQELAHTKNTLAEVVTKGDKAETKIKKRKKHVHFVEKKLSLRNN